MKLAETTKPPQQPPEEEREVSSYPPKPRLLSPAEYALRVEQFGRLFPRQKKPVAFTGEHWLL